MHIFNLFIIGLCSTCQYWSLDVIVAVAMVTVNEILSFKDEIVLLGSVLLLFVLLCRFCVGRDLGNHH